MMLIIFWIRWIYIPYNPKETLGLVNDSLVQFFLDYFQFRYQMYDRPFYRNDESTVWEGAMVLNPDRVEPMIEYPRAVIAYNISHDSPKVVANALEEL